MGKRTKLLKLMGMAGTGMEIAQMGMRTLIINVFPFSHNSFSLQNLYFTSLIYNLLWYFAHFVVIWSFWCMLHNFLSRLKFK